MNMNSLCLLTKGGVIVILCINFTKCAGFKSVSVRAGPESHMLHVPRCSQVFFVIRLIAGPTANSLPAITDADPLMACDLMDGRDAFLTLARDKHLEFSSLRRSKWSSMCMLVELHNQSQDRFVYTCNECKHHVETRFHCTVCEVRITRISVSR